MKSRTGLILVLALVVLAIIASGLIWYSSRYESTDDAQIDGHIDPVSARISGHIKKVYVDNGQVVKAGDLLVEIDPTDFQKAYDEARAAYDQAVADNKGAQLDVSLVSTNATNRIAEAQASVKAAGSAVSTGREAYAQAQAQQNRTQAQYDLSRKSLKRAKKLIAQEIISRQNYEQYEATAQADEAALAASRDNVKAAAKKLDQARAQLDLARAELKDAYSGPDHVEIAKSKARSASAAVKKAFAVMEQARLNLQYTRIIAPAAGVVGNKTAETGQNVSPGQMLMDLVQIRDVWVVANFKETQLHHMRPGQAVTVHVDAYDKYYKGHVESIGAATGEQFSLFPPENATGNYVKVVQRVPVKIVFDAGENRQHLLRPGMSVEPKVWIK
ncbi:MAG: HlyD family secretion protein [Desulfosarcinaceae bacterium]